MIAHILEERPDGESVRDFIRAYADDDVIQAMEGTNRISHIDYDWTLNAPEYFPELNAD